MNPLIYLRLLLAHRGHRRYSENAGFVMPLVILIGITLTVVGFAMMQRASSQKNDSTSKEATAKALSAAEAGVTRIQNLMLKNTYVALWNDCNTRNADGTCTIAGTAEKSWANANSSDLETLNLCNISGDTNPSTNGTIDLALDNSDWENLDSQTKYRMVSYTYEPSDPSKPNQAPGTGTLVVEGSFNQGSANNGTSRIEVKIPITQSSVPETIPGIWLDSGDVGGNNTILGNALLSDCDGNLSDVPMAIDPATNQPYIDPDTGQPYKAAYTAATKPPLPTKPTSMIDLNSRMETFDDLNQTEQKDLYESVYPGERLAIMPIPYPGDTPAADGAYHYSASSICTTGGGCNAPSAIHFSSNAKVKLYLDGNIEGNVDLIHNCTAYPPTVAGSCKPTDLQIFGYAPYSGSGSRPQVCVQGNNKFEAFLYLPEYQAGAIGTGGGQGGIKGSIWAYEWLTSGPCSSNTSNIVVVQTAPWSELGGGLEATNLPPTLNAISGWTTKAVN